MQSFQLKKVWMSKLLNANAFGLHCNITINYTFIFVKLLGQKRSKSSLQASICPLQSSQAVKVSHCIFFIAECQE